MLDRPRHEELVHEIRATGARIKFIFDGDVAGAVMAARRGHRHRPAARHRRHAGGHHRGLRDEVPRRDDPGQALAARRRRATEGARRRARPRPRCSTTDDLVSGDDVLLRRDRHHRRRAAARRPVRPVDGATRTRWSCAPASGTIRRSRASTSCRSCAPTPRSTSSTPDERSYPRHRRGARRHRRYCGEASATATGSTNATPGGSPANVAVGLARLGVPTELVTRFGTDAVRRPARRAPVRQRRPARAGLGGPELPDQYGDRDARRGGRRRVPVRHHLGAAGAVAVAGVARPCTPGRSRPCSSPGAAAIRAFLESVAASP